jgi:O-antigen ligase
MLILLYSFKENIARNKHLFIPMILLSIALIYYVVTSEIILDKISNRDSENSSFFIRANDNFACLRMFAENPLLGVGNGSLYESLSSKYGNVTASNGILAELARLGIFWGILYFSYFFKGINKITQYKKSFMFFFAFICILVLANEDMMGYPIAYIMTLQFKSYLDVGNEKNSYIPESTNSAQKIN